jgi:putative transposase
MIDEAIDQLAPIVGTNAALQAVGVDRATWYRRHRKNPKPVRPERVATPQPRALSAVERKQIKAALESDEFVDEAPATVYAKLLDQGIYLGSVATMYRILHEHDEVRERRRQATHPAHKKPELIAFSPNSVWSWDITKLHGPEKWTYYYLYVILDIFSRYAVGWMLARVERAALSERLISDTIAKQGVARDQLTLHSDRGSPMIAKPVAHLLADLGVTKSHSRPHVSLFTG